MRTKYLLGFTLVELLIAMAILGILSVLGMANFQSARIKARDISKKSDLQTIAKSLEAYVNDHRTYPDSDFGKIVCQTGTVCNWGEPFVDENNTIYTSRLPSDQSGSTYYYESSGTSFTLYAHLENTNDPALDTSITQTCGSSSILCNYKITSSNI
jgi:prepilin-type N-terminal cleavage/methylation domain-containing protein